MPEFLLAALEDGRLLLLIVVLVGLEAGVWWLYWRRTRRGPHPALWLPTLVSGAVLMLAVRSALLDEGAPVLALWLLAALALHIIDVGLRWRAGPRG